MYKSICSPIYIQTIRRVKYDVVVIFLLLLVCLSATFYSTLILKGIVLVSILSRIIEEKRGK